MTDTGTVIWSELMTTEVEKAKAFYAARSASASRPSVTTIPATGSPPSTAARSGASWT